MSANALSMGRVVGRPLTTPSGQEHGRIEDLAIRLADEGQAPLMGLLVTSGAEPVFVPIHHLIGLDATGGVLDADGHEFAPFQRRPGEVLARRDLLGHPLIHFDEQNHKAQLVRASDLYLEYDKGWKICSVDTAPSSKWRRVFRSSDQTLNHRMLDWKTVEPFVGHVPTALLRVRLRRLARLHPAAIADLIEAAPTEESRELMTAVGQDVELEADVLEELDRDHQIEVLARRSDREVAALLGAMPADDAADLMEQIPQERRAAVLASLPDQDQLTIRSLLGYNPETAGGLMTLGVIALPGDATAMDALNQVRMANDIPCEVLTTVFITDDSQRLEGSVPVVDLLRLPDETLLSTVAKSDPPRVSTSADLPEVATMMSDFNLSVLAVLNEEEQVVGAVTVDDVLELLIPDNWRRRQEAAEQG